MPAKRKIVFWKCPHTCGHTGNPKVVGTDYIFSKTVGSGYRDHMKATTVHQNCRQGCPAFNHNNEEEVFRGHYPATQNIIDFRVALEVKHAQSNFDELITLERICTGSVRKYNKARYRHSAPLVTFVPGAALSPLIPDTESDQESDIEDDLVVGGHDGNDDNNNDGNDVGNDDGNADGGNDDGNDDEPLPNNIPGADDILPEDNEGEGSSRLEPHAERNSRQKLILELVLPKRPPFHSHAPVVQPASSSISSSRTSSFDSAAPDPFVPAASATPPENSSLPILRTPSSLAKRIDSVWVDPLHFTKTDFYSGFMKICIVEAPWYRTTWKEAVSRVTWMCDASHVPTEIVKKFSHTLPGFAFIKDYKKSSNEFSLLWEWVSHLPFSTLL